MIIKKLFVFSFLFFSTICYRLNIMQYIYSKKSEIFYVYLEIDHAKCLKNTHNITECIKVYLVDECCRLLISNGLVILKVAYRLQSRV